ncbi:MAG TPA: SRPBCC family protein [Vicinamibacterales bacterium]|nr:SRPBCC family protein [Vicinamibacterales bacterium]
MAQHIAPLTVRHSFALPVDRVFDAWIEPHVASRWLFATEDGQNVRCDIDARPGGAFVITDRRGGDDVEHQGHYVEIDRPRRLVFTFSVPKYSSEETTVEVVVAPAGTGCEVTLVHHDVLPEWTAQTEQGWRELLARLEGLLQA